MSTWRLFRRNTATSLIGGDQTIRSKPGPLKTRHRHLLLATALGLFLAGGVDGVLGQTADLSITASAAPSLGYAEQDFTNTLVVSNAGPFAATGVVVSNSFPADELFVSASGGVSPTNGVLLLNLGSLAVGATDSVQVVVQGSYIPATNFSNVYQVYADQPDPELSNNTATATFSTAGTTAFTFSTATFETNLTSVVNQQATNYSTELIAVMPDGTVVYSDSFTVPFSPGALQTAITTAAIDLTNAGASSYTGPTEGSFWQSFQGSSSVTVTNVIGTSVSSASTLYVGPQTIMIGINQSTPFFILGGYEVIDTLTTTAITNLVTTTNTSTYLNSAVYMMTGIVAQVDLSLSIAHLGNSAVVFWPNIGSYTLQQNSNLATGSWTTSGYSVTTANGTNRVTISPPVGNLFFRLRQ